jgi:hypothetical protein
MALGSTQPLTEMNIRNLPGDTERPARKADNFTVICGPIVWKMWEPRRLTTLWPSMASYRDSFTLLYFTFSFNPKCEHIFLYTECPRRNVSDFRRVFLMLKYTDITQNTYVQS